MQLAVLVRALCAGAVALLFAACSVQLVSPYNEQIAAGLTKLHEDVLKTAADIARKASKPATRGAASYESYAATYDDWHARVATMREISDIGNPGFINCAALTRQLTGQARTEVEQSGDTAGADEKIDCQTHLLDRLERRISQTERLHQLSCGVTNPNFENDCLNGFRGETGIIRTSPEARMPHVQPLLRSIRALMWVQEAKKPKK